MGAALDASLAEVLAGAPQGFAISKQTATHGFYTKRLPLADGRNADGSALATSSPASGNFTLSIAFGTSKRLLGHSARNASATDAAMWATDLPICYVAGQGIPLTVNANYTTAGGTPGVCTVTCAAYVVADNGTMSSVNLVGAPTVQNMTATAADIAFTIAGATLTPTSVILVEVTTIVHETANAGTVTGQVNSVRLG
jgi:hypothetical protein